MENAQHYCALLNFACFVVFSASILALMQFPGGGHRARRRSTRARMPTIAAA